MCDGHEKEWELGLLKAEEARIEATAKKVRLTLTLTLTSTLTSTLS